jgi:hypothetical protein
MHAVEGNRHAATKLFRHHDEADVRVLGPAVSRPEAVAQHADEQETDGNHAAIMFRFAADRESIG